MIASVKDYISTLTVYENEIESKALEDAVDWILQWMIYRR